MWKINKKRQKGKEGSKDKNAKRKAGSGGTNNGREHKEEEEDRMIENTRWKTQTRNTTILMRPKQEETPNNFNAIMQHGHMVVLCLVLHIEKSKFKCQDRFSQWNYIVHVLRSRCATWKFRIHSGLQHILIAINFTKRYFLVYSSTIDLCHRQL